MASGGRWYPTTVALADGDIFTAMGSATLPRVPERWDERDGWSIQNGINFGSMVLDPFPGGSYGERNWWPLLHVAPNGKLFHSGPTPDMHWINTSGQGSSERTGPQMNGFYHKHGATVMYEEGRILTAGGWTNGGDIRSVADAFTVDINGPAPGGGQHESDELGPKVPRRRHAANRPGSRARRQYLGSEVLGLWRGART